MVAEKGSMKELNSDTDKSSHNTFDHLFCNHFSRKVVREIWFEKSGLRKVVDQKKRWFYTINPHFFRLEKSG